MRLNHHVPVTVRHAQIRTGGGCLSSSLEPPTASLALRAKPAPGGPGPVVLTVDVEDWTDAFTRDGLLPPALLGQPSRLWYGLSRLLELFEASSSTATFFVLARVARTHPGLLESLTSRGHRIACHGLEHKVLDGMAPRQLLDDLTEAREFLEARCGQPVRGFRAPWFSLAPATAWAGEIIRQAGFTYDSSLFPAGNPIYGDSSAPRGPHRLECGLLEVPPAVAALGPCRLPVAGGFYWRVFPRAWIRWGVERVRSEGLPATLYMHPWEFDPGRPWVWVGPLTNLVHYAALFDPARTLEALLSTGPGRPIEAVFPEVDPVGGGNGSRA